MISVKESESKYPKMANEKLVSNGDRSILLDEHVCPSNLQDISKMSMKDTDVLVIAYPRSGSTMTETLIWALLEGTTKNVDGLDLMGLSKLTTFLEMSIPGQYVGYEEAMKKLNHPKRVIKTHLPLWLAPSATVGKRIILTRDVKDVLVSLFHFYGDNSLFFGEASKVNFQTFYEMYYTGNVIYGDWFQFHRDWLDHKGDHIMWLRYEDLIQKFDETVKKLAEFLDVELTPKLFAGVKNLINVEVMKKAFNTEGCERFVRKGITGDHANYLTAEQINCLDKKTKEIVPELYFH